MRRVAYSLVLFASLVLVDACGGARSSRPPAPRTILDVDNQSFSDMTIYIVNGGQRIRLGRVTGKTRSQMTIPPAILGNARELQFLADPLGSDRTAVSNRMWVSAGERVTLMIPP
jgi:hypothetical protein